MPLIRSTNSQIHPCHYGMETKSLDLLKWCQSQETVGYVRLTPFEYANISGLNTPFFHYNMSPCEFIVGKDYAGLMILSNGHFIPGNEIKPTLRLDPWLRIRCISTENNVPFTNLSPTYLIPNDLGVSTPEELSCLAKI